MYYTNGIKSKWHDRRKWIQLTKYKMDESVQNGQSYKGYNGRKYTEWTKIQKNGRYFDFKISDTMDISNGQNRTQWTKLDIIDKIGYNGRN